MITSFYSQQKKDFQKFQSHYPQTLKVLFVLFAVDLLFVLLHLYSLALPLSETTKYLRLDMDFGFAEIFQYIKFLTTTIFLAFLFVKTTIWVVAIWSLFFLFLFMDDAFSFHEVVGAEIVRYFDIPAFMGLRNQDWGELTFVGVIGLFFMFFFLYAIIKGSPKARQITIHFFLIVGILVAFGVGMDMVHSILVDVPGSGILTVIEDSGEMLAASLLVWYSFCLFLHRKY